MNTHQLGHYLLGNWQARTYVEGTMKNQSDDMMTPGGITRLTNDIQTANPSGAPRPTCANPSDQVTNIPTPQNLRTTAQH
eukprot:2567985-Pyramimonas_sp.AAC.1